jgi:hypothetical protein
MPSGNGFRYQLGDERFIDERLVSRDDLLADLAPGGRYHKHIQPDGAWSRHVREHLAWRDGDELGVAKALNAVHRAELGLTFRQMKLAKAAAITGIPELLDLLLNVPTRERLQQLAEAVRAIAVINDPDEQRERLSAIAEDIERLADIRI